MTIIKGTFTDYEMLATENGLTIRFPLPIGDDEDGEAQYLDLRGPEGNAYAVMGATASVLKSLKRMLSTDEEKRAVDLILAEYSKNAKSANYIHLLVETKRLVDFNFLGLKRINASEDVTFEQLFKAVEDAVAEQRATNENAMTP